MTITASIGNSRRLLLQAIPVTTTDVLLDDGVDVRALSRLSRRSLLANPIADTVQVPSDRSPTRREHYSIRLHVLGTSPASASRFSIV